MDELFLFIPSLLPDRTSCEQKGLVQDKGGGPAGLALDAKNHVLFAFCRNPQTCVVLNADDGQIITTLPIGRGTDGGVFNPNTMEAFSSQGDGTLTTIRENSPTSIYGSSTTR